MAAETPEPAAPAPEGETPAARWYVAMDAEVYGPADKHELTRWSAEGRIRPGAQALRVGEEVWAPFHCVPGLEDIPLTPPPAPVAPVYLPRPAPPLRRPLSPCPHCGGQVSNIAPVCGWPCGLLQRSLKPQFACAQCGRRVRYEELTFEAQAQVTRAIRNGAIGWFAVVIVLIIFVALCFLSMHAALNS